MLGDRLSSAPRPPVFAASLYLFNSCVAARNRAFASERRLHELLQDIEHRLKPLVVFFLHGGEPFGKLLVRRKNLPCNAVDFFGIGDFLLTVGCFPTLSTRSVRLATISVSRP